MDVLKVQLAASEVGIFFQTTDQLSTQSSIAKKKLYYICRPVVNADSFNDRVKHDAFEYENLFFFTFKLPR